MWVAGKAIPCLDDERLLRVLDELKEPLKTVNPHPNGPRRAKQSLPAFDVYPALWSQIKRPRLFHQIRFSQRFHHTVFELTLFEAPLRLRSEGHGYLTR